MGLLFTSLEEEDTGKELLGCGVELLKHLNQLVLFLEEDEDEVGVDEVLLRVDEELGVDGPTAQHETK